MLCSLFSGEDEDSAVSGLAAGEQPTAGGDADCPELTLEGG